jgi:hypothetical protein
VSRGKRSGKGAEETAPASKAPSALTLYFQSTERPFASLVFLLPMVVLYEVGTRLFAYDPLLDAEQRIIAFNLIQRFLYFFGASGRFLPALTVVAILLAWHIANKDAWKVRPLHLLGMAFESVILSIPLFLLALALSQYLPLRASLYATDTGVDSLLLRLTKSIGAGVYEELVFRLIAFTVLSLVLVDVLKIRKGWAFLVILATTSVSFSAYHYLGWEKYETQVFVFRTVAGLFFGIVFLCRGFGVTAGAHAVYDIFQTLIREFWS